MAFKKIRFNLVVRQQKRFVCKAVTPAPGSSRIWSQLQVREPGAANLELAGSSCYGKLDEEPASSRFAAPGSRTWSWLQIRLEPGAGVTVSQTKRFSRLTTKLNRVFLKDHFCLYYSLVPHGK